MGPQSYSSITTFEKCPKKYHHLKVLKDVQDVTGPEAQYGNEFHKAAELWVRDDEPMPGRFKSMEPLVTRLKNLEGDKYCELKFGLRKGPEGFEPTGFFDDDVFWRGIIDFALVNGVNGRLVDYKTGKNATYADMRQLDLCAGAMFTYFPQLETIKSALMYVVSGDLITKEHHWENMNQYLAVFDPLVEKMQAAEANDKWNPMPSPLCGWCPVTSCQHWRDRKKR